MFNRRKHHASPLGNTSPDPSAATAAVQAFLASRASSASLSSSAAAAALRTHTTTPTQVSEVQTKRTIRRAASTSSNGSSAAGGSSRGPGGRGLRRQGSTGSMTERTFRDPSPNRANTRPYVGGAPPVPVIPDTIPEPVATRRTTSGEPLMRISSPPPKKPAGRGMNLDRYDGQAPRSARIPDLTAVAEKDIERPGSRGSVNFSYPLNGPNSPMLEPSGDPRLTSASRGERRVGSPAMDRSRIARGLDNREITFIQYSLREAADRPVKKKKKAVAKEVVEGRYLGNGTMRGAPRGTAVNDSRIQAPENDGQFTSETADSPNTSLAAAPQKKKKKKIPPTQPQYRDSGTSTEDCPSPIISLTSDLESVSEGADNTSPLQRSRRARVGGQLAKQPSVVREDREREEQEERTDRGGASGGPREALQTLESGSDLPEAESKGNQRRSSQSPPAVVTTVPTPTAAAFPVDSLRPSPVGDSNGSLRGSRPQSLSPTRNARFSATPLVTSDTGLVKHQPPPRSISPAKSALKHSPSRDASPMGSHISKTQPKSPSEASDGVSVQSDEGMGLGRGGSKKKKNVRVSFEDESLNANQTTIASESSDSPATMNRWFPLGKGKEKEETSPTLGDEDEGMKPVPILPTFGSIRAKRDRTEGGDRVEKVTESVPATSVSTSGGTAASQVAASSDIALGAIIANDFASKSTPISRRAETPTAQSVQSSLSPNDPIPPEVTSVEGTGWNSDTDGSLYDDDISGVSTRPDSEPENPPNGAATDPLRIDRNEPAANHNVSNGDVPSVVLVKPTPAIEKTEGQQEWLDIPGGFPMTPEPGFRSDLDLEGDIAEHHATDPTPASLGISEPEPEEAAANHQSGSPVLGEFAAGLSSQIHTRSEDESDSSGDSIYSDAAEDLSDLEGDGFGSIDAVVEGPMIEAMAGLAVTSPSPGPAIAVAGSAGTLDSQARRIENGDDAEPRLEEDWERAQAYWQGLSAQRNRQTERAAIPDASTEAVAPATPPSARESPRVRQNAANAPVSREPQSGYSLDPPTPQRLERTQTQLSAYKPLIQMKKSMRGSPANTVPETSMRSSMRSNPVRTSTRSEPSSSPVGAPPQEPEPSHHRGLLQKRNIRSAAPIPAVYPTAPTTNGGHVRNMSASTTASPTASPVSQLSRKKKARKLSSLRRTLSNESDSDSASSFKRQPRASNGSGFARRTMRSPPPGANSSPNQGSNARQLSPSGSTTRRLFSGAPTGSRLGQSTMRTTMRDSSNPSIRSNSTERTKSPSRSSFFSKSTYVPPKPYIPPRPVLQPIRSGFASRFADSSDEEDSRPAFRSRFADSDSDDGVQPTQIAFTPVRGIPRWPGQDDGESTELSDSSDDDAAATANRRRSTNNSSKSKKSRGSALLSGSLRRSGSGRDLSTTVGSTPTITSPILDKEKKRSFFRLGRKRKDNKIRKSEMESAARRDTPLERSKLELAAMSERPGTGGGVGMERVAKLIGEEWPLPTTNGSEVRRPATSDGNFGENETNIEGSVAGRTAPTEIGGDKGISWDNNVSEPGTGKPGKRKKKFTFLRKVFGLDT